MRRDGPRVGRPALIHLDRIVDVAERMSPGYTVSAVASRLGVDDSTLYRHIGSRAGLERFVAARRYERIETAAPGVDDWDRYLVTIGQRTRTLLLRHPEVTGYVLAGPYTRPTLAVFRSYSAEIIRRRPGLDERTAAVVGSRVVCLTAAFSTTGILRNAIDDQDAARDDVFAWSLRSLIAGMADRLDAGDMPTTGLPPTINWSLAD